MRIARYPIGSEADSRQLIDILQTNLPYLPHARRFSWLYLKNPAGPALVWAAADPETNRIMGIAAAFPRRICCGGRELRGYVLGDFGVDAGHRALGLAVALQRACLDGLREEDAGFAFDFPSRSMMAVYARLRIAANSNMVRYAKLLHADRHVAERVPVPGIARGLSAVVNAGLRIRERHPTRNSGWTIASEAPPWGGEFTDAVRQWAPRLGVFVARSAEHLNWRYGEHPLQSYEMLTARQGTRLCGYLIHHANEGDHVIADMATENDEIASLLLAETTAIARERGANTLSAPWLATHAGKRLLEKCGFRPREASPVVVLGLSGGPAEPEKDQWLLTSGDWEG